MEKSKNSIHFGYKEKNYGIKAIKKDKKLGE